MKRKILFLSFSVKELRSMIRNGDEDAPIYRKNITEVATVLVTWLILSEVVIIL